MDMTEDGLAVVYILGVILNNATFLTVTMKLFRYKLHVDYKRHY